MPCSEQRKETISKIGASKYELDTISSESLSDAWPGSGEISRVHLTWLGACCVCTGGRGCESQGCPEGSKKWARGGTHLQVGRPGNEACVGGRAIPSGLELQTASLPDVTWSPGHTELELRTGRGATHACGVMGANAGIVEGDHGMRRGLPTNSGESAEVNGQVSEQGTSLGPPSQPLCPRQ